ncbi:MAG TPA: SDR family oxidoreductase [Microbacteriaceae bacterium]|nr:SDR family oxidoreductase [Microbacteriaceae bacterium]
MEPRLINPVTRYHTGGFPEQEQEQPGLTEATDPTPDHGERSYRGCGRLAGMRALITGGDSGIGRATAIAFAREGANVAISYLPEEEPDAVATALWIEQAEARSCCIPGDIRDEAQATRLVDRVVSEFGGLDILVLNAAYQKQRDSLAQTPSEEIQRVIETNLLAPLWTARAAIPHMEPGSSIIVTSSIQAFNPSPELIDYAMTKAALIAFTKALAQELGPKGVRVNAVAPGPIWTPLIPATEWPDHLPDFGTDTPLGRAGQPAEVAPAYVYLASPESSYVSGAVLPVTGGKGL